MSAKNAHLRLSAVKTLELEYWLVRKVTGREACFRGLTTEDQRADAVRKLIEGAGAASKVAGLGSKRADAKKTAWTYADVWSHVYGRPWPTADLFTEHTT